MIERAQKILQEREEILFEAEQLVVELTRIQAERTRIQTELELLRQQRQLTLAQASMLGSFLFRFEALGVEEAMLEEKALRLRSRAQDRGMVEGETND